MAPLGLVLLAASSAAWQDFSIRHDSLSPEQGEISAHQAHQYAEQIVKSLGYSTRGKANATLFGLGRERRWIVDWTDQTVFLNSRSGILQWYINSAGDRGPIKRTSDRKLNLVMSEEQARAKTGAYLIALGFEKVAKVTSSLFREQGDVGSTARGTVIAQAYLKQRKVVGAQLHFLYNLETGKLVSIMGELSFYVETEEPVLTPEQASLRASSVYESAILDPKRRFVASARSPELAYVTPSKTIGGPPELSRDGIARVRIAYLVPFGKDQVWIDAVDGKVLGGVISRERPKQH